MERAGPTTPCRVNAVFVRGTRHTLPSVVEQELRHLRRASTLGQIHAHCAVAAAALQSLGVFESATFVVDSSSSQGAGEGLEGSMPLADVTVQIVEKKRLASASTGVHTTGGEGSMDADVSVRNIFGFAERLGAHMEAGQHKSNTFSLHAIKPRPWGTDAQLKAELVKTVLSHQRLSSFTEKSQSMVLSAVIGTSTLPGGSHEFAYELAHRRITQIPVGTSSWAVLQQRGMSLKSSLKHTYVRSNLNDPIVPTSGCLFKVATEVAGIGAIGDAAFHKHTAEARAQLPLTALGLPRFSIGVSASLGLILPLVSGRSAPTVPSAPLTDGTRAGSGIWNYGSIARSPSCQSNGLDTPVPGASPHSFPSRAYRPPQPLLPPDGITILDRYFLGGPHSLWGFRTHGVGPREQRHTASEVVSAKTPSDALGGELLVQATVDVSAQLPGEIFERAGARVHLFGSTGALHALSAINAVAGNGSDATMSSVARAIGGGLRAVVGAGLVVPTPLGRFELNLMHVLQRQPGDSVVRSGIQIGVCGPAG